MWWQPADVQVSWTTLGIAAGLAVLGEVLEFVLEASGSRHTGRDIGHCWQPRRRDRRHGTLGAAVGTLIEVCLGSFIGSLLGDLWTGRLLFPSVEAGWEVAVGRFGGTVSKLAIGGIIVVILELAAFS